MDWAKPKQIIRKYTFNLGIIMIVISGVVIIVGLIWIKKPYLIDRLDKVIPDLYEERIEKQYERGLDEPDVYKKYLIYRDVYSEVKDLNSMKRYFSYKRDIIKYLIDYYLSINEVKKAMDIAEYWTRNSPRNIESKYNYIKVMTHINTEQALDYYNALVKSHPGLCE